MSSGISCVWTAMRSSPTSLYTFFRRFYVLWGIYETFQGRILTGLLPPLVVSTPFIQMGYGLGVWVFLFYPFSCLGCWLLCYIHCLWIQPLRCIGPIFLLFHYFGLSFSCLKFGIFCDLSLEDVFQFSKCINFFVPKGANRASGVRFLAR